MEASREEYLWKLRVNLTGISEEEKEEALEYYKNYFEEAGVENEQQVIMELGKPAALAKSIISDINDVEEKDTVKAPIVNTEAKSDNRSNYRTGPTDYSQYRQPGLDRTSEYSNTKAYSYNNGEKKARKPLNGWVIFLLIITFPVWISLLLAIIGVGIGLVMAVIGLAIGVVVALIGAIAALIIGGIIGIVKGLLSLAAAPVIGGFAICLAVVLIAVGVLFIKLFFGLFGGFIPGIIKGFFKMVGGVFDLFFSLIKGIFD